MSSDDSLGKMRQPDETQWHENTSSLENTLEKTFSELLKVLHTYSCQFPKCDPTWVMGFPKCDVSEGNDRRALGRQVHGGDT